MRRRTEGRRRSVPRDRDASETAGQDIRHIPAEERETPSGGSAVGLQRYEKNSAAVCRIGDSGQERKKDSGTEPFLSLSFSDFPVDTSAEP